MHIRSTDVQRSKTTFIERLQQAQLVGVVYKKTVYHPTYYSSNMLYQVHVGGT